jgi:hypothetical protein
MESNLVPQSSSIDSFLKDKDEDELGLAEYVQQVVVIEGLDVEEALSMGLVDVDDLENETLTPIDKKIIQETLVIPDDSLCVEF